MNTQIVLVCGQYPTATQWGGIGAYTRHHARQLRAAGASVSVLTGADATGPRTEFDDGIIIRRVVPTTGGDAGLDRHGLAKELVALAAAGQLDVVEGPEYCAPLLQFQRAHTGVPVVIRLHGAAVQIREVSQARWRTLLAPLSSAAISSVRDERDSVRLATLVSASTRWSLDALRGRGWTMCESPLIVPNPIVFDAPLPAIDAPRATDTVCVLGRLDRVKGADLLPQVMQRVWSVRPQTHFVSIGQDTPRTGSQTWGEWLLRQIPTERHDFVTLRGGMPPAEVSAALATQRIALMASVFETFPYALLECMSHGLACVAACAGGPREMGRHGTHLMLAQRTPESIGDTLLQLLQAPGTVRALATAAQAHVLETVASPVVARRVLDSYGALVADSRRSAAA